MSGVSRRRSSVSTDVTAEKIPVGENQSCEEPEMCVDANHAGMEVAKLRRRWELAVVLNFLSVYGPLIGDLKLAAEEIEMGLVKPNAKLAQLHINLLKGIPPVSKSLHISDAWITAMCKKLVMWWPWVAEGEIPLKTSKGEETSKYNELDPVKRLVLLKALCEVRADQHDATAYVNDSLKEGTDVSFFRRSAAGEAENGMRYWYEKNRFGNRLYREHISFDATPNATGNGSPLLPTLRSQWETLATNLNEFHKVADGFSSSKVAAEVAIRNIITNDAIPVLKKRQRNQERALKQKEMQQMPANNVRFSHRVGTTRSCRARRTVSYTFDEYNRAIKEAIQLSNVAESKEQVREGRADKDVKETNLSHGGIDGVAEEKPNSDNSMDNNSTADDSDCTDNSMDNNSTADDSDCTDGEEENDSTTKDKDNVGRKLGNELDINHSIYGSEKPHWGVRWSRRLSGEPTYSVTETLPLRTKNRSRQRPVLNAALEGLAVPDSEDENSGEKQTEEIQVSP